METVSAREAKNSLSRLLKRVAKGESIRITIRGLPVARLVPESEHEKKRVCQLVDEIRRLRQGAVLGKTSIAHLINNGRRY